MRRGSGAALACLLLGSAALARADDDLVDFDEQEERKDSFWARVAHPDHGRWRALVDEARKADDQKDPKRALGLLDEAVKLEPNEPEGRFLRGFILQQLQRWSECADEYNKVLAIKPDFRPPQRPGGDTLPFDFDVGTCLALGGHLEASIPFYQRVLAAGVPKPEERATVYWNLGDSFQALGRLEEAIDAYRDGIEAWPAHAMLRLALGVAYDRDGQVALAVDAIQESLGINPAAPMTAPNGSPALFVPAEDEDYYRGIAHKVARRRNLAIVFFRSYLERAPRSPWATRAREHMAQLGPPALVEADVDARGLAPEKRGPWQKPVAQAGAELQKCLEGKTTARLLVEIGLPVVERPARPADKKNKKLDKKPAAKVNPGVSVSEDGPGGPHSPELLECVRKRAAEIKLPRPKDGSIVVTFGVIAR
jgi:tetratricopeptide (TPR) repeat protein